MSAARWLPDLAPGPVGGLAFFTVAGLFSAALSMVGLHAYSIINELTDSPPGLAVAKGELLADGLRSILFDGGTLVAFAAVVFLLAFPVSLPVLYGYIATYFAFVIWVTGLLFMEGLRNSLFYHALLSLIGVSLIVLHVFTAGRDVPIAISGVILVVIAAVVLGSAAVQFVRLSRSGGPRKDL